MRLKLASTIMSSALMIGFGPLATVYADVDWLSRQFCAVKRSSGDLATEVKRPKGSTSAPLYSSA
jgi:hypothetical protein